MDSIFSAPGKILWIGGYAVLERPNVSLVTGVNKRVYAKAEAAERLRFMSKQFGFNVGAMFDRDKTKLDEETPAAKFVVAAAEATLVYLKSKGHKPKSFVLETYSDPAFGVKDKAGLGSSAAVTTASVGAILGLHDVDPLMRRDLTFKLAQYAHSQAQGKVGSGFDIAAAVFGASSYVRFSPSLILDAPFPACIDQAWDYELYEIPFPSEFRVVVAKILGQSASTSEMVKLVNAWMAKKPVEYQALMRSLNRANQRAIEALKQYNEEHKPMDLEEFCTAFEEGRQLTQELGVKSGAPIETGPLTELVDECMRNGAFAAKLPGAGGGDSVAALCASEAEEKRLRAFLLGYSKVAVKPLDLELSNEGLRREHTFPVVRQQG